jgi:L-ascorbate peroxidase
MKTHLKKCEKQLTEMIEKSNCHPIFLRLAWSDAATFDQTLKSWPNCGGVNGTVDEKYPIQSASSPDINLITAQLLFFEL